MTTQMRDKYPGVQRSVQDALTFACFDLPVVDIKLHWLLLVFQLCHTGDRVTGTAISQVSKKVFLSFHSSILAGNAA